WAGEVISSREKTSVHEEFRELEKDIELRKDGMQRLLVASEAYHHAMSKKKGSDVLEDADKLLPVDTLGIVMITHGAEFGEESPFGQSLVKLGRAHCKIATLQEAYALTFKDTFLTSMERFKEEIKEYELLRKKLDGRRSAYDTASAKFEKVQNSKKDKDRREAEDELDRTRQRYDETAEDLRAHMHAIQENEHSQLRELTSFLALETNFVQSYLDILVDLKTDWQERYVHIGRNVSDFLISAFRSSKLGQSRGNSPMPFSHRPPSTFVPPRPKARSRANSEVSPDSSDDEQGTPGRVSRNHGRTESTGSRPSSRPVSRLSRKRTNSTSTSTPAGDEKETAERSRRLSVAGWASSAVDSVTGGRGKKNKDKEAFAALGDGADDKPTPEHHTNGTGDAPTKSSGFRGLSRRTSSKNKSKENLPSVSPQIPSRILKPPSMQGKKVVRALYDFSGSSDELSFKAGKEIVVLNEVLDDWWMGEVDGQKGLFPMSYTEALGSKPPLPNRPNRGPDNLHIKDHEDYLTSDADEDRDIGSQPMLVNKSPFYGGFNDAMSVTSSMAEEEDDKTQPMAIMQRKPFADADDWFSTPAPTPPPVTRRRQRSILLSLDPAQQPLINRSVSDSPVVAATTTPTKKAPPPPPPRRNTTTNPSSSPPIPERKASAFVKTGSSTGSLSGSLLTTTSSSSSAVDLDDNNLAVGCGQFRQNPFKPKGICSNCLKRKIAVLGSRSVGKSSLVKQFIENHFVDSYYPTIESTFAKSVVYKGIEYDCHIIDTAGQDEYSPINSQYAIGIHGYVLVYSITSKNSFNMIQIVYDKIVDFCGVSKIPCVIVGSKSDLSISYVIRQVDSTDLERLAKENDCACIETSAKNNVNVGKVFELCLQEIEKNTAPNQTEPPASKSCVVQ
ncbi:hypothetical protein B0H34DRAFT_661997, partial [Crassisporium funariophilum]